jgi:putative SOS response-associated peptidase YedK
VGLFRSAWRHRRCLIPASGFFEWQATGKQKQPYFIHPRQGGLLAFAGLWERWSKGSEPLESCTILTTTANATVQPLHERMPVILSPQDFRAWLDPQTPLSGLQELLHPCPAEAVGAYLVSPQVGNPRHDDATCIAPVGHLFSA